MNLSLTYATWQVSVTWALVVIACALWYYAYGLSARSKNLPPGSLGWPLVGETISLARKKVDFFREKRLKYGDVYKTHLLMRPTIRVSGAPYVQKLLKGENKIVVSYSPKSVRTIFGGEALSQTQGKDHLHQKRNFVQCLVGPNLSRYLECQAGMVENAIEDWTSSKDVGLLSSVEKLSLGSLLSILYGNSLSANDVDKVSKPANVVVDNLLCVPINLPGTSYNKAWEARGELAAFGKEFITKLLASGGLEACTPMMRSILGEDLNNNGQEDFLNNPKLMNKLTDCNIELIVAGRSTLYSTTVNSILMLDKHPNVLVRIREELTQHALDNPKTSPLAELTLNQLKELTYLDQTVKEVLRLFPPVGGGFRMAIKPFELAGYDIPKDWALTFSIRDTHEMQDIPMCREFQPDRWNKDNAWRPDRERYAYIPFGAGARSCPGKEFAKMVLKLTLVHLCRSSNWSFLEDFEMSYYPLPIPTKDVRIRFSKRHLD